MQEESSHWDRGKKKPKLCSGLYLLEEQKILQEEKSNTGNSEKAAEHWVETGTQFLVKPKQEKPKDMRHCDGRKQQGGGDQSLQNTPDCQGGTQRQPQGRQFVLVCMKNYFWSTTFTSGFISSITPLQSREVTVLLPTAAGKTPLTLPGSHNWHCAWAARPQVLSCPGQPCCSATWWDT